MEKTELLACPMTADEAIRILTESNELLVGQMAQLSEIIGEMENAPERERESWYDSLDHCQREYDAVAFAIDHLRRTPSPDNKPLTVELPSEPINARYDVADMLEDFKKEAEFSDHSVGINGITWAESALLAAIIDGLNVGRPPEKGE